MSATTCHKEIKINLKDNTPKFLIAAKITHKNLRIVMC